MSSERPDIREAFEKAYEWFCDYPDDAKRVHNSPENKSRRPFFRVQRLFKGIMDSKWKVEGEQVLITDDMIRGSSNLKAQVVSNLRHQLRHVSRFIIKSNDELDLKCSNDASACAPKWKQAPDLRAKASPKDSKLQRHKRIVVAGKLWRTEFLAEFMLGAQAMADELGIELYDCRQKTRTYKTANDGKTERDLVKLVRDERLDPTTDAILAAFEDEDEIVAYRRKLAGFRIVTTGYTNGTIHQNDDLTGYNLAAQCIEDEKNRPTVKQESDTLKVAIFVRFSFNTSSNAPNKRLNAARQALEDSGLFVTEEVVLDITFDPPCDDAATMAVQLIREKIATGLIDENSIAAIFPKTEGLTREMMRFAASLPSRPRVYGERLIASDLKYLSLPGSPLWAICGVLPYYYGRYAVRAAAFRWQDDSDWPEIDPVLITNDLSMRAGIISADRVVSHFRRPENRKPGEFWDVELVGEDYAWDYA